MIQLIVGTIVAIWFFNTAGKINLHRGKWVFIGIVSFLIPSILWAAIFYAFLRKPLIESAFQSSSDGVTLVVGTLLVAFGSVFGFVSSYVINRKYLTQNTREAAVNFEQKFVIKVICLSVVFLLSAFVLYLAIKYSPELVLESKFDYTLF